jgi:hypothetical protein
MRTSKKKSNKNITKKRKIDYDEEDIKKCMEKKCSNKTMEKKHKELTKVFEDSLKRNEKKLEKNGNQMTEEEKMETIQLIKNAKKNIVMMNSKYMINKNIKSMRDTCKINNCDSKDIV